MDFDFAAEAARHSFRVAAATPGEQRITQIFLPNPDANHTNYVEAFKLTEAELKVIKMTGGAHGL